MLDTKYAVESPPSSRSPCERRDTEYTLCLTTTNQLECRQLKRRKVLLTNSHRDVFANDKHDAIPLLLLNILIVQFYNA
jgi:hypothetical protein